MWIEDAYFEALKQNNEREKDLSKVSIQMSCYMLYDGDKVDVILCQY